MPAASETASLGNVNFLLGPPISVFADEDNRSTVVRPGDIGYEPPPGLSRGLFDAGNGLTLSYYYTTETNIHNANVSCIGYSGFKYDLTLNPREMNAIGSRNIPYAGLAIPNPGRDDITTGYMDDLRRGCERFIVDPPGPAREIINSRIPKAFMGYSTGGQIFIEQANDPAHYEFLADTFCGAVLQSPMLEVAPLFGWLPEELQLKLFNWYANRNPEYLPEETPLGSVYLKLCKLDNALNPEKAHTRPTLGQSLAIASNARERITGKIGPHLFAKGDIPVVVFIGAKDKFAAPRISEAWARSIGAAVYIDEEADHAPICFHVRNLAMCFRALNQMADGTFDRTQDYVRKAAPGRLSSAMHSFRSFGNMLGLETTTPTKPDQAASALPERAPQAF